MASRSYVDFNYPLWLTEKVSQIRGDRSGSNDRVWLSQPRKQSDSTWEILTTTFRKPVTITQVAFDALQIQAEYELYFYDRNNQRKKLDDKNGTHYKGNIGQGEPDRWITVARSTKSVIATKAELRIRRRKPQSGDEMLSLGIKNLLFKREVREISDMNRPIDPETDSMGNLVYRYADGWTPDKAIDNTDWTFWKSSPQPTPDAVVNLFVNCKDSDGKAQLIDRFYLDPAYSGCHLNVYYTNDEREGAVRLNQHPVLPWEQALAPWVKDQGLRLSESGSRLVYNIGGTGLSGGSPFWFGMEWTPNFNSSGSDETFVLFRTRRSATYHIELGYDSKNERLFFRFVNYAGNYTTIPAGSVPNMPVTAGMTYKVGVGFERTAEGYTVFLFAYDQRGSGSKISTYATLRDMFGIFELEIPNVRGIVNSFLAKQEPSKESLNNSVVRWKNNPSIYLDPDVTDGSAEDTLVGVTFAGNFRNQGIAFGGLDSSRFTEKMWSPIWKDWVVEKGDFRLPSPVYAKYLKFEFSQLVEEPYPVWESGIEVNYQTFPDSLKKAAETYYTTSEPINPNNVSEVYRVQVNNPYYNMPNLKNTDRKPWDDLSLTSEVARSDFMKRNSLSPDAISESMFHTMAKTDWLDFKRKFPDMWDKISTAVRESIDFSDTTVTAANKGTSWWLLPGHGLKIPADLVEQIAGDSKRRDSSSSRVRFPQTMVHRYQKKTAVRDKGMAYFAGVRELDVYTANYFTKEDSDYIVRDFSDFQKSSDVRVVADTAIAPPENLVTGVEWTDGVVISHGQSEPSPSTDYSVSDFIPVQAGVDYRVEGTLLRVTFFKEDKTYQGTFNTPVDFDGIITAYPNASFMRLSVRTTRKSDLVITAPLVMTSPVYPSLSTFMSVELEPMDRGLRQMINRVSELAPIGLSSDESSSSWADSVAKWKDQEVFWGSRISLASISYQSNFIYDQVPAVRLWREESGDATATAGLESTEFSLKKNSKVRVSARFFKQYFSNNNVFFQMADKDTGDILFREQIEDLEFGSWTEYVSKFFDVPKDYANLTAQLLFVGAEQEEVFVASLGVEVTSIKYEVSNNGGKNFYEVTETLYRKPAKLSFPETDNRFQLRITMYETGDYVFGFNAYPDYDR